MKFAHYVDQPKPRLVVMTAKPDFAVEQEAFFGDQAVLQRLLAVVSEVCYNYVCV